ncbi:DUF1444 domain-containing protein [Bacillus sp. HMF5848]|uniref:DUF1444 domain-containing protein n=1 Tax=Bacillus sp. HMF5848 TaxID=2495421 RepID=UPI000F7A485C|nr:DUF1444 domain-containing protein [Bacillus sp. HMF5848]RSK28211.1 DUF1444 domain-containing protein [Bacillus sp. HMF5848]
MNTKQIKDMLVAQLDRDDWTYRYDAKKDTLRIEDTHTKKGITVSLPNIVAKWEQNGEAAIDEVVYYITEALTVMNEELQLNGKEKHIFPVIRSTSFPDKSNEEVPLLYDDHTAETRIYYAVDLGKTYRLIDESLLARENWDRERLREVARFNVRSLEMPFKKDEVAGNVFYFINTNDGYDASRILHEKFLKNFSEKVEGEFAIATPHQDVLILADIRNDTGYDVLAQMAMSFFASGRVPITALPFLYEDGNLEPIFILAKNKQSE